MNSQTLPSDKARSITSLRRELLHSAFMTTGIGGQLIVAGVIGILFLALYLITQSSYYTFDAVSYAQQILTYEHTGNLFWIFHPHHLLFNGTGCLLWLLAKTFGYRGGPLPVIQTMNATLGAIGLSLFYITLRRILTRSHTLAVLLTVALGCSFGYWVCATDARVNMPSITCLIAATLGLVWTIQAPGRLSAITAGFFAGLAVLYHESAGLYLIVGCTGVALADFSQGRPDEVRKARIATLAWFVGAWGATVLIPYLLVGTILLHLDSIGAYRSWAARYAELGWWWSFDVARDLRLDIYGIRRALFVEPIGKTGTFHVTASKDIVLESLYFLSLGGWIVALYCFITALPLLFKTHYRPFVIVSVVWLFSYIAFFTFWSPEYFVFWVPAIVASCLMFALSASPLRAGKRGILWITAILLWVGCFAYSNYSESIKPHMSPSSNPYLTQARDIALHTHTGDIVILSGMGDEASAEVYIPYFAKRYVFSIHTEMERRKDDQSLTRDALLSAIDTCRLSGGRVFCLNELWNSTGVQHALLSRHHLSQEGLSQMFSGEKLVVAWKDKRGQYVWLIVPKAQKTTA